MENQIMQDAPPIPHRSGFVSQSTAENSHQSKALDTTSTPPANAAVVTAPSSSGATAALAENARGQSASKDKQSAADSTATAATSASPTQLSREQILDATLQCLFEKGYDATTIRQIAARLGCAIGSIYRYYRDKHDLLSCVTQRPFEAVAEAAENNESFPAVARMYSKLAAAETQSYMLMFWLANQKRKGDEQTQSTFELPQVISRIISAWSMQMGTRQAALSRWSVLHGAVTAGADPLAMLTAMGLMTTGHANVNTAASNSGPGRSSINRDGVNSEVADEADDEPHDRTAQQIVTVMRTPPMPRPKADVTPSSPAAAAGVAGVAASNEPANSQKHDDDAERVSTSHVRQKEDVCLL